jgi:hypothetical protein
VFDNLKGLLIYFIKDEKWYIDKVSDTTLPDCVIQAGMIALAIFVWTKNELIIS